MDIWVIYQSKPNNIYKQNEYSIIQYLVKTIIYL